MKSMSLWLLCFLLTFEVAAAAEGKKGALTGGQQYAIPSWFKQSFLDLRADLQDANAAGRHLMLFVHLNQCPYCARTLEENFTAGETKEFIARHFDVIALNIRGSQAVEWFDNAQYSEAELARRLGVIATPTIVFIDAAGKKVLQLNGYRAPDAFRQALEYVQQKAYRGQILAEFVKARGTDRYRFRPHAKLKPISDFSAHRSPLAVMFEDKNCVDCDEFHERVLQHPAVLEELSRFTFVRLDAYSDEAIVDVEGRRTTPREWAERLALSYRPGIVLFDDGRERARLDGMLYSFHFKELLRYVSGKFYARYKTYAPDYLGFRQRELIEQGVVIDISK